MNEIAHQEDRVCQNDVIGFRVRSAWRGGARSRSTIDSYTTGGRRVYRYFTIAADEPFELAGQNTAPNPQEMLMAALNACLVARYVAEAALKRVTVEQIDIETAGELDLRGRLRTDPAVAPGFECLRCTVRIKADGSDEQLRELHEQVMSHSPNYFNLSRPVRIDATLEVR